MYGKIIICICVFEIANVASRKKTIYFNFKNNFSDKNLNITSRLYINTIFKYIAKRIIYLYVFAIIALSKLQ